MLAAPQPPPQVWTNTTSNPFSDSHEVLPLADVDVGSLNQVELSVFASEARRGRYMISVVVWTMRLMLLVEAAIVLEMHRRDATTQEVFTTIPLDVNSGVRTEDGEMLRMFY